MPLVLYHLKLLKFQTTISWVRNQNFVVNFLPKVIFYQGEILKYPRIAFFIRREKKDSYPFSICALEFVDKGYFFQIPLVSGEKYDNKKLELFERIFINIFGN